MLGVKLREEGKWGRKRDKKGEGQSKKWGKQGSK
jgi:hypothetical protein